MSFTEISENLFLFDDVCNVYVVKKGKRGVLINAGKAKVLRYLDQIEIREIDWVLHTHYHRNLCLGDHLLVESGAKIAVPARELNLLADARGSWEKVRLFSRYSFRQAWMRPRENVPVDAKLQGDIDFTWFDYRFRTVDTPGPTEGSISLISEIDDVKVAFTGDLIHSPGKVWNLYTLQRNYIDACREGVSDTLKSLDLLQSQRVELLLPSYGNPIKDVPNALSKLEKNLLRVVRILSFKDRIEDNSWHLLPHLYYKHTSYFIVSESGKVMMCDYIGAPRGNPDPYWASQIIREVENFQCLDIVLASHYHDDHVGGFNKLRERFGTEIWAYENMVDILENPSSYNLPCLFREPIKVNRVLRDGEKFQWEEYEFTAYHFPGQTEYHMAIYGIIDDKKVLFIGDSALSPSTIFRAAGINALNYCRLEEDKGLMKCAKLLLRLKPDYVLPSHRGLVTVTEDRLTEYLSWARELVRILTETTSQSDVNMGWDPNWVSIYPYSQKSKAEEKIEVSVNVRNHLKKNAEATVNLELPKKWKYSPLKITEEISPKSNGNFHFQIQTPCMVDAGRTVIGANIIFDGTDRGELAEAIIEFPQTN